MRVGRVEQGWGPMAGASAAQGRRWRRRDRTAAFVAASSEGLVLDRQQPARRRVGAAPPLDPRVLWVHVPAIFVFALLARRRSTQRRRGVDRRRVRDRGHDGHADGRASTVQHGRDLHGAHGLVRRARAPLGRVDRDALPLLRDGGSRHAVPGLVAVPRRHRLRRRSSTASPAPSPRSPCTTTRPARRQPVEVGRRPRRLHPRHELGRHRLVATERVAPRGRVRPRSEQAGRGPGGRPARQLGVWTSARTTDVVRRAVPAPRRRPGPASTPTLSASARWSTPTTASRVATAASRRVDDGEPYAARLPRRAARRRACAGCTAAARSPTWVDGTADRRWPARPRTSPSREAGRGRACTRRCRC